MKFKREKQKLIIELNSEEESGLKGVVSYWKENIYKPTEAPEGHELCRLDRLISKLGEQFELDAWLRGKKNA